MNFCAKIFLARKSNCLTTKHIMLCLKYFCGMWKSGFWNVEFLQLMYPLISASVPFWVPLDKNETYQTVNASSQHFICRQLLHAFQSSFPHQIGIQTRSENNHKCKAMLTNEVRTIYYDSLKWQFTELS